ncbi:histidine kinase [Pedobacter sp. Du54]|uniref:sensor histidine kinase n=1 Tax=Pedobacter anseongensis TaxID=3133439 RepID=UPI00309E4DCE
MNSKDLQKIEFWVATGIYLLTLFLMVVNIDQDTSSGNFYSYQMYPFRNSGINFSYLPHYFLPKLINATSFYFVFLLLNFYLIPALIKQANTLLNVFLLFSVLFLYGLFTSIGYTYSKAYLLVEYSNITEAYFHLFVKGYTFAMYTMAMFALYVLVKTYAPAALKHIEFNYKYPKIMQECAFAAVVWLFILFLLITQARKDDYAIIWAFVVPLGILQYGYSLYRLLPDLKNMNIGFWGYLWRSILLIALTASFIALIATLLYQDGDTWPIIFTFNMGVHCLFTTPFTWLIYNYRLKNKSEISYLKQELGKSDASLSFLQSQINPHFLFNALNTLYGTALQENAERTGEGIQKLGDMMRFMLHENVQERISLTRDVDYLENYIALQKLRTSRSADIVIDVQIEPQLNNLEITPMLLIPFVENAFKHGISLQHPSYIKVTLQTKDKTLYFDVHNSIHIKPDTDPEKFKSGIGLQNVKQRLALLYPGKHELIIRESAKEFFIHLTMQL